jgi:hypothetical protein
MKSIRQSLRSLASLALLAFAASAAALDSAQDPAGLYAPLPAHASLYTFADVFRLTSGGAAMPEYAPAPAAQGTHNIPVALASAAAPAQPAPAAAQPQAAYTFSIGAVPRPEPWVLVVSGLALAGWVARRRLGYSF